MKIHQYSLMKDVTAVQNKPRMPDTLWQVSAPVKKKPTNNEQKKGFAGVMQDLHAQHPLGR